MFKAHASNPAAVGLVFLSRSMVTPDSGNPCSALSLKNGYSVFELTVGMG